MIFIHRVLTVAVCEGVQVKFQSERNQVRSDECHVKFDQVREG